MRIERISDDQFTIFLTFEDLVERGFTQDDLWHDASNIQNLFSDMMYEASTELGFELEGILLVQVHLMQAQGMHIIVTQRVEDIDLDFDIDEDFIEMKVTLDESRELIFSFGVFEDLGFDLYKDENVIGIKVTLDESWEFIFSFGEFEDIIQVSSYLGASSIGGGQVYHMDDHYYMLLDDRDLMNQSRENVIAIMSEFAQPSIVTSHRLKEYGKVIYDTNAVKHINQDFI